MHPSPLFEEDRQVLLVSPCSWHWDEGVGKGDIRKDKCNLLCCVQKQLCLSIMSSWTDRLNWTDMGVLSGAPPPPPPHFSFMSLI